MSRKEKTESRVDLYARITEKIIADLEKGVRPWVRPWSTGHLAGRVSLPLRHNGLPYQGINTLLLWSETVARGFVSPTWMTYKQSAELGGQVRKGETGSMVVYASRFTRTEIDASGEEVERGIPFLKAYTVFCADQIDDLPAQYYGNPAPVTDPVERIAHADAFFANTGAVIRHGGNQAFFAPLLDIVQMPPFESFQDAAGYYATLGHEMTHWVGSDKRLDRNLSRYNKDRSFRAREELVADLGGCFLAADLGIVPELEPRPDHASYLANWLTIVKNDRRFIFAAAAHAQRAVTYLHGLQPGAEQIEEAA